MGFSNDFLNRTPKAQEKKKINWTLSKSKIWMHEKYTQSEKEQNGSFSKN